MAMAVTMVPQSAITIPQLTQGKLRFDGSDVIESCIPGADAPAAWGKMAKQGNRCGADRDVNQGPSTHSSRPPTTSCETGVEQMLFGCDSQTARVNDAFSTAPCHMFGRHRSRSFHNQDLMLLPGACDELFLGNHVFHKKKLRSSISNRFSCLF